MTHTFTCSICGETYESDRPEDETIAEMKANFGDDITKDECQVVCDDCYDKIKPEINQGAYSEWLLGRLLEKLVQS